MQPFDVCRNLGTTKRAFPYFVVVQSRVFQRAPRRRVVPLASDAANYPAIAPGFTIEGSRVVADALLMFSIPGDRLGPVVTSLADDAAAAIMDSIDRVFSRAFG